MKADGTGEQTETMVVSVQSGAAVKQFSVVSAFYAKLSTHVDFVYVRVHHPDGTITESPLDQAQEQPPPVTQQAPFYSDLMIKQLPVKGLGVGDTLEWQTHMVRTTAEAPNEFWAAENFLSGMVVEDQAIELHVPSGLKLKVRTKNKPNLQMTESDSHGKHVYRWTYKQLDPTVGPEAEAQKTARKARPLTPDEEQDELEGSLADVAWTTFPDWDSVGEWYRGLEQSRIVPDDAIRAKVAEITAGKTTQEEKVRAVYAWVSGQIRYIGVAFGIGRYQPHAASTVLENQYGDCKDKHTLLAAMLSVLGLHPDAVLVGPGIRFDRDVPSPASFDHLITHLSLDGKDVWLDSTAEVADYRVLVSSVRNKDALVVPERGPAIIARTPAELPFKAESTFAVTGSLNGDLVSESTITITHHDDTEINLRAALRQISPSQYDELIQSVMGSYGFGGKITDVEIEHVNDSASPLVIRFHYHREHEEGWGAGRITAIFGPTLLPAIDKNELPHAPLNLGTARTDTSTLDMKLPSGWTVELPEAVHKHSAYGDCDVTYHLKDGRLSAERRVAVAEDKVPSAELKAYADWYDACGAGSVPYIQLINPNFPAASSTDVEKIRKLRKDAGADVAAGRYDDAEAKLKEALAADPNAEGLLAGLGLLAARRHDHKEAMRLLQKEIDSHPGYQGAYKLMATLQGIAGEGQAAADTWMRLQKLNPHDPTPSNEAILLWISLRQDAEAVKQVELSKSILAEDVKDKESFRMVAGQAEIRGSDPKTGEALLMAVAKESTELGARNDVSYQLSVVGRQLPFAEETERAVLAQLDAESRSWTGDEAQTLLTRQSSLIEASWDTMGWILFKQDKVQEAEKWIRAAAALRPDREICEHLGDILMKENRPADAALAYSESMQSLLEVNQPYGQSKASTLTENELQSKLDAAMAAAHISKAPDGRAGLQALRTWNIGAAHRLKGTAEFRVLLSPAGIPFAQPVGSVKPEMQKRIESVKWTDRFPPGEDAQLAAKLMLNCYADVCELVKEP